MKFGMPTCFKVKKGENLKIGVWKEEEKKESKVLLRLQPSYDGVRVVAVNSKGALVSQGILLYIENDGRIRRATSVSSDLPFKLDSRRRIKLKGEKTDC